MENNILKERAGPTTQKKIPALAYSRTSSRESLVPQKGEVNQLAREKGYEILRWYCDICAGALSRREHGKRNRSAFRRLLHDWENGLARVLILYDVSRLSRLDDPRIVERLKRSGIKVVVLGRQ
jgi:DNA invertase Pin-like site-specific DNA recombinase